MKLLFIFVDMVWHYVLGFGRIKCCCKVAIELMPLETNHSLLSQCVIAVRDSTNIGTIDADAMNSKLLNENVPNYRA